MRLRTKGAALAEYAIVAALVATSTITFVLFLGDNAKLPICIAEEQIGERVLGEQVDPCQPQVANPNTPPPPPPPGPTTETFVVPSESTGFFNPVGVPSSVEATVEGDPLLGHPQQTAILNALCVALGHLAPASGLTVLPAENGDARFLTGGRWVWQDTGSGFAWVADTGLAPYGLGGGLTPVVGQLTCTRPIP
jgi:hypothetical protein